MQIDYISGLTLPDNQTVGVLQAVSQLKAQNTKLAETAIGHSKLARTLSLEDVSQRGVFLSSLLVMND